MTRAEALKVTKPILINMDTVRAILDEKKTVTRRLAKDIPITARCISQCRDYANFG